jgi:hypothetical protein
VFQGTELKIIAKNQSLNQPADLQLILATLYIQEFIQKNQKLTKQAHIVDF